MKPSRLSAIQTNVLCVQLTILLNEETKLLQFRCQRTMDAFLLELLHDAEINSGPDFYTNMTSAYKTDNNPGQ